MHIIEVFVALCLCLVVSAVPYTPQRIIGGSLTTISQYPASAALLYSQDLSIYTQQCGSTILNTRSVLTAAQCVTGDSTSKLRIRVGSSFANSGGIVHNAASFIPHPDFDGITYENDIAIIRTATNINYNDNVRAAVIAGPNYVVADNRDIWTAGWGVTSEGGSSSEQLRHVAIRSFNQNTCYLRYFIIWNITDSMLCTSYLGLDDRGLCDGDTGSALYRNGVVVGVYSRSFECASLYYPSVSTRVSSYTHWIRQNA